MAASTVNTMPEGSCEPFSSPVRNSRPTSLAIQFLGEHGEFDAAAEPLVLVDDESYSDAGGPDLPSELHGGLQLGAPGGAVEIFSEKTRVTPASARESSCASRDCRAVEARA